MRARAIAVRAVCSACEEQLEGGRILVSTYIRTLNFLSSSSSRKGVTRPRPNMPLVYTGIVTDTAVHGKRGCGGRAKLGVTNSSLPAAVPDPWVVRAVASSRETPVPRDRHCHRAQCSGSLTLTRALSGVGEGAGRPTPCRSSSRKLTADQMRVASAQPWGRKRGRDAATANLPSKMNATTPDVQTSRSKIMWFVLSKSADDKRRRGRRLRYVTSMQGELGGRCRWYRSRNSQCCRDTTPVRKDCRVKRVSWPHIGSL
ncbi:hypothetical protein EXIGLDRAFT_424134 [Exidia glandulosa HHB12029]|uniref:Uncharacterized protein n=1 Tax=Exidia glandulosa HHB12029 TaxID=1314781 RepID=A0A165KK59_EXIGL|nr:hypothetical protein EXIGLDRAFT_424134 [Exidia glandulosa HHB12029]